MERGGWVDGRMDGNGGIDVNEWIDGNGGDGWDE